MVVGCFVAHTGRESKCGISIRAPRLPIPSDQDIANASLQSRSPPTARASPPARTTTRFAYGTRIQASLSRVRIERITSGSRWSPFPRTARGARLASGTTPSTYGIRTLARLSSARSRATIIPSSQSRSPRTASGWRQDHGIEPSVSGIRGLVTRSRGRSLDTRSASPAWRSPMMESVSPRAPTIIPSGYGTWMKTASGAGPEIQAFAHIKVRS